MTENRITTAVLIYHGSDEAFGQALADAAGAISLPYQTALEGEASDINPAGAVHVVDGDEAKCLSRAANSEAGGTGLWVLAVSEEGATAGYDDYADVLVKSDRRELLAKRLAFYCRFARESGGMSGQDEGRNELQENEHLRQRVAQLEVELGRVDSHLDVHTQVIAKINHISKLSQEINCLDIDRIASVCMEAIPELIAARYASLYAFDAHNEVLHLLRRNHPYNINRLVELAEHPHSPMTRAIRERKLMLIKDLSEHSPSEGKGNKQPMERGFARNYQTSSCIIAPLVSGNDVFGVLNLADKVGAASFDEVSDLPPINLFCEILGSAMSNIRLYEEARQQARIDGMTGLLNHRSLYDGLHREVELARRYGSNLSLIMVDLDDLKLINDQYGHQTGDRVLICVAQRMRECARDTDLAARYGGDEFAIVLPNTGLADAMVAAQRLLDMVSLEQIQVGDARVDVSLSIGVSQFSPAMSVEGFMNAADVALLEAKAKGKSKIEIAGGVVV